MERESTQLRKAQLDKEEREHLEDVVTEMRDRVEANVRYQLEDKYEIAEKPDNATSLSNDQKGLIEAIELEAVDADDWSDGFEQYITGVGYTIVNRLAALRCMEVRNFVDDEVTAFREDGLTPAADRLVTEEFMLEEEAVLEAYRTACDDLADEIEILFDRSTAYSLIDPDDDTFEDLCGMLDEVPDEVWRGDDVLGWVYEYYNSEVFEKLSTKGVREGLEPDEVAPATQFYTPHWVVRMLTDNSLGKLYLEKSSELQGAVEAQKSLTPSERKNRPLSPNKTPDLQDFCTYLVPSEKQGEAPDFEAPRDIRVIDPACGSGHFLLYAFDVLERIWRKETNIAHSEIPRKILKNNLYGIDIDMRACQLAAFNLYLKARTRAEREGAEGFDIPEVGIVCADSRIAEVDGVKQVFDEVADGRPDVQDALGQILDSFEEVNGIGSLLDVRGTLSDIFEDDTGESVQITLNDDPREDHTLGQILHSIREAVDEHRDSSSFLAQDLRSFIRLLDLLAQDYHVSLMNPPYGSRNRMPKSVKKYLDSHYNYPAEFYINFLEVCDEITKEDGRIGMLSPRSFLFKDRDEQFRNDFIGGDGSFDFLAEFGYDLIDNAMVGTAATVIRSGGESNPTGDFIRLHDIDVGSMEQVFIDVISGISGDVQRQYEIELNEFSKVPGNTICYSIPSEVRDLHDTNMKLDADVADLDAESIGFARQGVATADDFRFLRSHWEVSDYDVFKPFATSSSDAWILPPVTEVVEWRTQGARIKRHSPTVRTPNEFLYGESGLTWTRAKRTGRRFGFFPSDSIFSHTSYLFVPKDESILWELMAGINSDLYHALFLSLTIERDWVGGVVGKIPWVGDIAGNETLRKMSRRLYDLKRLSRTSEPTSSYYTGASLLPTDHKFNLFYNHPHGEKGKTPYAETDELISPKMTISKAAKIREITNLEAKQELQSISTQIDKIVYESVGISESTRNLIQQEIYLRTSEDPEDREVPDPESVSEVPDDLDEQVKDLVHHFAMEAVRKEDDGIIPLEGADDQPDMLERIVDRFHDAYGEHAEDRLVEVDDILGSQAAGDEAYPNLRTFIEEDLFAYHVGTMENTPIVWKLSTERLLADSQGEGFACFVDYHQIDASLFDRLSNQYLEPRKSELRDRRAAANQRRNDASLSTTEQAAATETFEFCSNALEQIAELEETMGELERTTEREFDADDRELVDELAPKVRAFRTETAERIDTLEALRQHHGEAWFQDTFSDGFWDKVDEWRDEWLDALAELEHACEQYAKPSGEPVEAHLADLFDYFNWRLKGSDHYSSTGILFMTYYFEREGGDLLDDAGEPHETLTEDERKLASLAMGLDDPSIFDGDVDGVGLAEYKQLAEEIDDRCQTVYKQIPSDWVDRALSEITTDGYRPNHKHGVAINITPLAEKNIVPEVVENKVL